MRIGVLALQGDFALHAEALGEGMKGIEAAKLLPAEQLQTRGW